MAGRRMRTVLLVVLGAAALAVHLTFGAWAVLAAAHWAGYAAVAVVAMALAVLVAVHVAGLRRLRAPGVRRRVRSPASEGAGPRPPERG